MSEKLYRGFRIIKVHGVNKYAKRSTKVSWDVYPNADEPLDKINRFFGSVKQDGLGYDKLFRAKAAIDAYIADDEEAFNQADFLDR